MRVLVAMTVMAALGAPAEAAPWTSSSTGEGASAVDSATELDDTGAYRLAFACDHGAGGYVLSLLTPDPALASIGATLPVTFIPDGYLLDPVTMTAENEAGYLKLALRAGLDDKPFGALADALATATQAIEIRLDGKLLGFSVENVSYAMGHVTYLCLN